MSEAAPVLENVADVYPLTPMQEGMLFHTVAAPRSGVFLGQLASTLTGDLDVPAFTAAWSRVVERHPALRTAFLWEGLDDPLQVVRERVEVPWRIEDWRAVPEPERERRYRRLLDEDRAAGFDPGVAPLVRLTLLRLADDAWRWVWTAHHLILDGWSTALLLQEAMALYAARRDGDADDPAELTTPVPFRSYVQWRGQRDAEATRAFWEAALAGFASPTPVIDALAVGGDATDEAEAAPADEAPAVGHHRVRRPVPARLAEAMEAFGRAHRVTASTLVQGAWALTLARLADEPEVVVGATTSGRPPELSGAERAVGCFIGSLPLRIAVDGEASVADWLAGVQRRHLALREHEHASLAGVQRWSDVPAGEALFESLVVFESYPGGTGPGGLAVDRPDAGLAMSDVAFVEQSNYPLALLWFPGPSPELVLVHDPERLARADVVRAADRLLHVLEGLLADGDRRVADVPLCTEAEARLVLETWNDTDAPAPDGASILERLDAAIDARPGATRLASETTTVTGEALRRDSTRLARGLRALGVEPGTPVGLLLDRDAPLLAAMLGAMRARCPYVPLDPSYPDAHVRFVLDGGHVPVVLTTPDRAEAVASTDGRVLTLEALVAAGDGDDALEAPRCDDVAYVLHTSGSTGRPKGVEVTHANLLHSTVARFETYGEDPTAFLLLSSPAFDSSVAGIHWTLAAGGTLVLPPARVEQDLGRLLELLRRHRTSHLLCLPSLWALILERARDADLRSLRTVIVAGEACPPSVVREHRRRLPRVRLVNEYGPTEATVWCTAHECTEADERGPVPIGRPIPRMRCYVLDRDDRPVPPGVRGRLVVAGDGVARGYLGDPGLTAERFSELELAGRWQRAYRTGDLASWRPDGRLCFHGRADRQVKVRGHRLEPEGLEQLLAAEPTVDEAAVLVRDGGRRPRLVAYVTAPEGAEIDGPALHEHLRAHWPAHLVPDDVVPLAALPRLANGKLDRARLPDPRELDGGASDEPVAPRDAIERDLAAIWAELLDAPTVGVHDDFFALGGDSLVSIRVMSRIEDRFGRRLPLAALLERRTVAGLAAEIRAASASSTESSASADAPEADSLVPIRPTGSGRPIFCVHAAGGHVLEYRHLAERLDPDRPVHGLEPVGLDGRRPPHESIEAMAEHYLRAVRAVQPQGPYALVGHCVGAIICWEMCARLRAAGEAVELLAVIDADTPGGHRRRSLPVRVLRHLRMHGVGTMGYVLRRSWRTLRRRLQGKVRTTVGARSSDAERRRMAHVTRVVQACQRAQRTYDGPRLDVPVLQVRSSEFARMVGKERHLGWDRFTADLERHVVPARHRTILAEPDVAGVAEVLSARLERGGRGGRRR